MINWLKENWEILIAITAVYVLVFSAIIGCSWLFGYWYNGITTGKFEINSCWQGLAIVLVNFLSQVILGVTSIMRFKINSELNSDRGVPPVNTRGGMPLL